MGDERGSSQANEEHSWQILVEFKLPSSPGNEREAAERVAEAVACLNLPPARLERLKTAVAEAAMNAAEHGNQNQPQLPVSICVMADDTAMTVKISDCRAGGEFSIPPDPDIEAKMQGEQTTRGWGFFLIQKLVDEVRVSSEPTGNTIQLFLYLEGKPPEGDCISTVDEKE